MTSRQGNTGSFSGTVMATAMLAGCSGYGGGMVESSQQITIDSEPVSATIYANGTETVATQLTIRPGEVFQSRFTSGSGDAEGGIAFRYVGTLAIKKPGCKDYFTRVDDNILASDIHVDLEQDGLQPVQRLLYSICTLLVHQSVAGTGGREDKETDNRDQRSIHNNPPRFMHIPIWFPATHRISQSIIQLASASFKDPAWSGNFFPPTVVLGQSNLEKDFPAGSL